MINANHYQDITLRLCVQYMGYGAACKKLCRNENFMKKNEEKNLKYYMLYAKFNSYKNYGNCKNSIV